MGWFLAFFAGWFLRGGCGNRVQRRFMAEMEAAKDGAVAEGKKAVELARYASNQGALGILGARMVGLQRLNVLVLLAQESGVTIPPEVIAMHLEALDEIRRTQLPPLETLPVDVAHAARELLAQVGEFRAGIAEVYADYTEPEVFH